MQQYRKVSMETHSQVSSETLLNSLEVLITSRGANMVRTNVSQETRGQNPCGATGMLIVDAGITLVVSKQKMLQVLSVQLAPNVRLRPIFLLLSVGPASQQLDMSYTSHCKNARQASSFWPSQNARSIFLCQNVRPTFSQSVH